MGYSLYTIKTVSERIELIFGLIILWIIQTAVHLSLLWYLHDIERKARVEEQQDIDHELDLDNVSIELEEFPLPSPERQAMSNHAFYRYITHVAIKHWDSHQMYYLICIPTFAYLAMEAVIETVHFPASLPWQKARKHIGMDKLLFR